MSFSGLQVNLKQRLLHKHGFAGAEISPSLPKVTAFFVVWESMKSYFQSALCAIIASVMILGVSSATARAENAFYIDEVRFGGTWTQPRWLPSENREENQAAATIEILFDPFDWDFRDNPGSGFLDNLVTSFLTPRFHIGGLINPADNGTSAFYAGLTWHVPLGERLFFEGTFGGAINDGETDFIVGGDRADLGSNVLFRESVALGVNITDRTTFLVQLSHQSHAGLAGDENHGLTNLGAKFGVKF